MTPRPPLVSVIIPAYNAERYVAEAIDSALAQTYPAVEVVVVNDGSTDGTEAVIAQYGDRVVSVKQSNRGLAGARNTGLAHARGTLIALLDADDIWLANRLERLVVRLIDEPDLGVVTSDAWLLRDDTRTTERYYADHLGRTFPEPGDQREAIIDGNFVFVGAVLHRRLLDQHGGFHDLLRRAEDYELWCRLIRNGVRFGYVDEPLAWYRLRADSLSADVVAQWEAHLSAVDPHFDAIVRRGRCASATLAFAVARRREAAGDHRGAGRAYRAAATATDVPLARRARLLALSAWSRTGRLPRRRAS